MLLNNFANFNTSYAYAPKAAVTDNTVQTSETLTVGASTSVDLVLLTGTLSDADATFTLVFYEGDASDMSDEAAVADADLVGTEAAASFTFADDNKTFRITYRGSKKYVRAKITPANNSGNFYLGGIWIAGAQMAPGASV